MWTAGTTLNHAMSPRENLHAHRFAPAEESLRCVWTSQGQRQGDREEGHACATRIPLGVVREAWLGELREGQVLQGFFNFSWAGGVWLGYGLSDGRVRGVYCPAHCAERAARDARDVRASDARDDGAPARVETDGPWRAAVRPSRAGHLVLVD